MDRHFLKKMLFLYIIFLLLHYNYLFEVSETNQLYYKIFFCIKVTITVQRCKEMNGINIVIKHVKK